VLIIFDLDGVLIDSEPLAAEAMSTVLGSFGYDVSPNDVMHTYTGLSLKDILAKIEERFAKGLPAEVAEGIWPATRKLFGNRLAPMPGVVPFLQELPWSHCVASSSLPERIRFSLEVTGLLSHFEERYFSSSQVARGKPAPDLFLHAARTMRVEPRECVVIEDSMAGVTAAVAVGMHVIGFAGGGHAAPGHVERLKAAGATVVVDHWSMVPTVLGAVSGTMPRDHVQGDGR
jgi:HAD superfamily hydrolase (TIGR01509 family)